MADPSFSPPRAAWRQHDGETVLELAGDWRRDSRAVEIEGSPPTDAPARYDTNALRSYDSTLPAYILAHLRAVDLKDKEVSLAGLPEDLSGLLKLALSVPEKADARSHPDEASELRKLGKITLSVWKGLKSIAEFTGESLLSLGRFALGRARYRRSDFWVTLQQCGVEALPIVSLISFLIGLILAFVGSVQLANFGANIFVANLVGIAMVREMGVVMTGIIMSGRTGAAFAAHIGSMKANEEIDALRTFGLNPFDFLVLPRLLALILMMPLLTIYANVVGIIGGMLVGMSSGISPILYWHQTVESITLQTAFMGVFKSFFFGAAIAMCGCLQGMRAGNSSAAVGEATTKAVVASITAVIVLDSAFAAIFTVLGI